MWKAECGREDFDTPQNFLFIDAKWEARKWMRWLFSSSNLKTDFFRIYFGGSIWDAFSPFRRNLSRWKLELNQSVVHFWVLGDDLHSKERGDLDTQKIKRKFLLFFSHLHIGWYHHNFICIQKYEMISYRNPQNNVIHAIQMLKFLLLGKDLVG